MLATVFRVGLLCSVMLSLTVQGQSLFNPAQYRDLTADRRAYRVGDTLTVIIVQQSTAEARAGTRAQRDTDISARYRESAGGNSIINMGLSASRKGDATTRRDGFVRATLTATVTFIQANGQMNIEGRQQVSVNGERQQIIVRGLVRVEDIRSDNTLLSPRISNADIEISGHGDVSEVQNKGLIDTILGWLGLL